VAAESAVHDALTLAQRTAVHLEMRDAYDVDDPDYADWRAGRRFDPAQRWASWFNLVRETVDRGVDVRRARIVSEPVTEYIRFEYDVTAGHNIAAGERVRWLPRRLASDLTLPGNDFWLFDHELVIFNHFSGNGGWAKDGEEPRTESAVVELCSRAFEDAWQRSIPHEDYQI
jgi:hypothetical protein